MQDSKVVCVLWRFRFGAVRGIGRIGKIFVRRVFAKDVICVICGKRWCVISVIGLCVFLAGAAVSDLRRGKVYNWWLLIWTVFGVWRVGAGFFLPAAAVLVPAFLLFRLRMMGAGDGKLMAVAAGYLGLDAGLRAIGAGLLVGAIWSLCRLWRDRSLMARLKYFSAYFTRIFQEKNILAYDGLSGTDGRHQIPLASCLAVGVCLYLLFSGAALPGRGML